MHAYMRKERIVNGYLPAFGGEEPVAMKPGRKGERINVVTSLGPRPAVIQGGPGDVSDHAAANGKAFAMSAWILLRSSRRPLHTAMHTGAGKVPAIWVLLGFIYKDSGKIHCRDNKLLLVLSAKGIHLFSLVWKIPRDGKCS